jgi:hypothetical protein
LFGCGEGTQRGFAQKRQTMKGLGAIFLPGGSDAGRAGLGGGSTPGWYMKNVLIYRNNHDDR